MASIASYKDYANLSIVDKDDYNSKAKALESMGYTQKGGKLNVFSDLPAGMCINLKGKYFFLVAEFRNKHIRKVDSVTDIRVYNIVK